MSLKYVVGFVFNERRTSVVLLHKRRPAWQAGLLNGPGGMVGANETWEQAMEREFAEEAGVVVPAADWTLVAMLRSGLTPEAAWKTPDVEVAFLMALDDVAYVGARTCTDEEVDRYELRDIGDLNVIPNLRYLVPLAAAFGESANGWRLHTPVTLLETHP